MTNAELCDKFGFRYLTIHRRDGKIYEIDFERVTGTSFNLSMMHNDNVNVAQDRFTYTNDNQTCHNKSDELTKAIFKLVSLEEAIEIGLTDYMSPSGIVKHKKSL